MEKKIAYCIRKFMTIKGTTTQSYFIQETFMVNSHSEVQEYENESEVDTIVSMLNSNSDDNCRYEKVKIG